MEPPESWCFPEAFFCFVMIAGRKMGRKCNMGGLIRKILGGCFFNSSIFVS